MKSNPYLSFNGECEAAFAFYEQCLGGKITEKMTYGGSPMAEQIPPEQRDQIMHITLTIGDITIMGADSPPQMFEKPQGFSLNLNFDNIEEAERVFDALAENGTVRMPIQETFWARRFGMTTDRFGTPWMINCETAA
jgi:PhnB protein